MKNAAFLILVLFLVTSCVTKRYHNSWQEYPSAQYNYYHQVGKISVIVDHVREDNIANQIKIIAETHLESHKNNNNKSENVIYIDITIEQRSFMQNMEMYNSIYISCIAHDGEETIYAKENEFISGKKTFISVPEQKVIITRVLDRLLRNQQKWFRDIKKQEEKTDRRR